MASCVWDAGRWLSPTKKKKRKERREYPPGAVEGVGASVDIGRRRAACAARRRLRVPRNRGGHVDEARSIERENDGKRDGSGGCRAGRVRESVSSDRGGSVRRALARGDVAASHRRERVGRCEAQTSAGA